MAQETDSAAARENDDKATLSPHFGTVLVHVRRFGPWLGPLLIVLVLFVPAWLDARLCDQGRARSGITLLGVSVHEKTADEIAKEIERRAPALERRKLGVVVSGKRFELEPSALSFRVDTKMSATSVMKSSNDGGFFANLAGYWKRRFTSLDVPLVAAIDREKLEETLLRFEHEALKDRPFSGGIELTPAGPKAAVPRGGSVIERRQAETALRSALVAANARDVSLPVITVRAPLPASAADEALSKARALLSAPLTLRSTDPPSTTTIAPNELGPVLKTEPEGSRLRLVFDSEGLAKLVERVRREIEREPVNAKFVVDAQGAITIEPSRPGLRLDLPRLGEALLAASASADRSASLPLFEGSPPSLDTARAGTLGIKGLVSSFTTRHPCCEKRVENIHRIADILDGTVVEPGQTVSVNALVGPRTLKNGFIPAPTIEEGEIVDSIGGGISQFATTFFNALFHGGYDIVERQPHTFWFPRYPMGHEATLSWPKPDIIFKNDTAAGLLIKTHYTGTSITVKLYGDNGGRKVQATVSGRKDVVDAPLEIVPNPKLAPDEEKVKEPGSVGWHVIVSRQLTFPDGTKKEERRKVTYKPRPRRVEVHPCRIPKGEKGYTGEQCPEPKDVEEAVEEESPKSTG